MMIARYGDHAYWYGFVYRYRGPAFVFGHLRHDDGSACGRTYEMYSRRMGKTGAEKVTRSDSQPGGEVLKTFSRAKRADAKQRGKR
jgi:hypothetical protein